MGAGKGIKAVEACHIGQALVIYEGGMRIESSASHAPLALQAWRRGRAGAGGASASGTVWQQFMLTACGRRSRQKGAGGGRQGAGSHPGQRAP
jgi:hypothetical protein